MQVWMYNVAIAGLLAGLVYHIVQGILVRNAALVVSGVAVLLLALVWESRRYFSGHDAAVFAASMGIAAACVVLKLRATRSDR
jgi:hypothetical protein